MEQIGQGPEYRSWAGVATHGINCDLRQNGIPVGKTNQASAALRTISRPL